MLSSLLAFISSSILLIIQKAGYIGIFVLMLLQSVNIPIPSEITMPFAGFLASTGEFNFWLVVILGTMGNLTGAYLSYNLANILLKNGLRERIAFLRFLISKKNLDLAQKWFEKYGAASIFFGRMIPVLSTFISFPAGLAKMDIKKFIPLTFGGSLIWSYFLAKLGFILGENWTTLQVYFRKFDYLIAGLLIAFLFFAAYRHFFRGKSV